MHIYDVPPVSDQDLFSLAISCWCCARGSSLVNIRSHADADTDIDTDTDIDIDIDTDR